jgi:sigma-E factor negative regulatory protein RseC
MKTTVRHPGIVQEANGGIAIVKIERVAACAHCASGSSCGMGERAEFTLEAPYSGFELRPGESVVVLSEESAGVKAVVLTYGIPSLLLVAGLAVASTVTSSEAAIGAIALAVLIPYYLALYLLRGRIGRAVSFKIEKSRGVP